jgi:RHS repeat-associated protein
MSSPRAFSQYFAYGVPRASGSNYLLAARVDPYGRASQFSWTNEISGANTLSKLLKVTDKDGRESVVSYTNLSFPTHITAITDPYGRTARFLYDHIGRLTNITDMAGMSSSFTYDGPTGIITNMVTPYGSTGFRHFEGPVGEYDLNRAIEITEANGAKQLYTYRDYALDAGASYHSDDAANDFRNSFHWDRNQFEQISTQGKTNYLDMPSSDYWKASLKHWYLVQGTVRQLSDSPKATAGPVVAPGNARTRQVAYEYYGQTENPIYGGTLQQVTKVVRDGVTVLDITRNDRGRPTSMTYHTGASSSYTYTNIFDGDGRRLLRVLGPRDEQVRGYGYHPILTNLLVSVTNAMNEEIHYTHNTSTMRVTSILHPGGLLLTNVYYSSGPSAGFLQMRSEVGFATNYFTYTNGNLYIQTNALGLTTTNFWDDLNRLVAMRDSEGYRSNVWDKLDLVAERDRLGNWTRYAYNSVRQLMGQTNANGQVTTFEYCDCGSPSDIIRYNGVGTLVTTYDYDLAGRLTTVGYPDDYTLIYTYDGFDRVATVTDGGQHRAEFTYDRQDQLKTIDVGVTGGTPLRWETREYDEYGNVLTLVDRNAVVTTNNFDFDRRLIERRVGNAGLEQFHYLERGLTNYVDGLSKSTKYVRDARGQALYQTNANFEVLGFTYNPFGDILTLKDGKNQVTKWNYDAFGRVTNKVDALNAEMFRYKYDPEGQLTNRWQAGGITTTYRFDEMGNLTNVVYSGGPLTAPIALRYDLLNRLTNMVDGIGSTVFAWTPGGQLASEDGPWSSDAVSYGYSHRLRSGLSLQQASASPWQQSYAYEAYRRLTNVTSQAGAFGTQYKTTSWNSISTASELVEQMNLPGGGHIDNSHDGIGRLLSTALKNATNGTLNSHSYVYNDGHQRTKQTFLEGNYVDYAYDNIGQLKTARGWESGGSTSRPHEQFGYAYDAAWNLNYRTNNALTQSFGVNSLNQLTNLSWSGTFTVAGAVSITPTNVTVKDNSNSPQAATVYTDETFARSGITLLNGTNVFQAVAKDSLGRTDTNTVTAYLPASAVCASDSRGNLTNDGRRVFYYDSENQLTNVLVAGAWKSEFAYDGLMRRKVRREFSWSGSGWIQTNEVRYIYDGRLVIQERHYTPQGSTLVPLTTVTYTRGNDLSGTFEGAGGIGGLLDRSEISNLKSPHSYYHSDGNGNITALVNTNGLVVARYSYDPYGTILAMSGPLSEANLYRFSSKEWHAQSGLVYYLYRYYEPSLQRWVNRDPIGESGGINLYSLLRNDALAAVDSFGLAPNQQGTCDASHIVDELRNNQSLENLRDTHSENVDRYFYTDKYGWVDVRHFAEAARRAHEGEPGWWVRAKGFGLEGLQWLHEWGDDYRSGFSPEDIPSNSAGVDFGQSIRPGDDISVALELWLGDIGGRAQDDPSAGRKKLPLTDPSVRGGAGRGSNGSSGPQRPDDRSRTCS